MALKLQGLLLFDIDGVIRDVAKSYRRTIQKTVEYYTGWHPELAAIDALKAEGTWNNDWDASLELIRRYGKENQLTTQPTNKNELISVFNDFYFGGDPEGDPNQWNGFIKNETLLTNRQLFDELTSNKIGWGFLSGAESSSAKFILEKRLGLKNPPLIAMGDAPEKPNPLGLIELAEKISTHKLGAGVPPIAYLGDTVADVLTIKNARKKSPMQKFLSLGVSPPHLHMTDMKKQRSLYEEKLRSAGADKISPSTNEAIKSTIELFNA